MAHGVKMGRKTKLRPHHQREVIEYCDSGEPVRGINVRHATISRLDA
jgi:hypothetical protein